MSSPSWHIDYVPPGASGARYSIPDGMDSWPAWQGGHGRSLPNKEQEFIHLLLNTKNKPTIFRNNILFHYANVSQCPSYRRSHPGYKKIVALAESPAIAGRSYDYVKRNANQFDIILTCDKELLERYPQKCQRINITDSWICYGEMSRSYPKNKNISAIFSNKLDTTGHRLRHEIYNKYKNTTKINFLGRITGTALNKKFEGLQNYRYSLAVENCQKDFYFTEKVLDCFATRTMPIFWGGTEFLKSFNSKGFFTFDTVDELDDILDKCTESYYNTNIDAVEENFQNLSSLTLQREHLQDFLQTLS